MSTVSPKLLAVAGSIRSNSFSKIIVDAFADLLAGRADIDKADIASLPHYNQDLDNVDSPAAVQKFKAQVSSSDGVIIVSPEFNHGIPGVLKNALDWGSRPSFNSPFRHKPVLIVTSSVASTGGVRAQHSIRDALASMLASPVPSVEIAIAAVHTKIANGKFADAATLEFVRPAFDALFDEIDLRTIAARSQ